MNRIFDNRSSVTNFHRSPEGSRGGREEPALLTLREILLQLSITYENKLELCAKSFSAKRVHDLRVASRRLCVALKELKPLRLGLGARRLRKAARKAMKSLGKLRDVQVHKSILREHGGLLFEKLNRSEARFKKDAILRFAKQQKKLRKLLQRFKTRVTENQAKLSPFSVVVAAKIKRELSTKIAALTAQASDLDVDKPRIVHRFRLDVKRFRYRRELLAALAPNGMVSLAEPLKELQRLTGGLHDIDVLIKRMDKRKTRVKCAALFDDLIAKRGETARDLRLKLFYFTQQAQGEVLH